MLIQVGETGLPNDGNFSDGHNEIGGTFFANADGFIHEIDLKPTGNNSEYRVGTYYPTGGGNFTCRDVVRLAASTGTALIKRFVDFNGNPINLEVKKLDLIGIMCANHGLEYHYNASTLGWFYDRNSDDGSYKGVNKYYDAYNHYDQNLLGIGATVDAVNICQMCHSVPAICIFF